MSGELPASMQVSTRSISSVTQSLAGLWANGRAGHVEVPRVPVFNPWAIEVSGIVVWACI